MVVMIAVMVTMVTKLPCRQVRPSGATLPCSQPLRGLPGLHPHTLQGHLQQDGPQGARQDLLPGTKLPAPLC